MIFELPSARQSGATFDRRPKLRCRLANAGLSLKPEGMSLGSGKFSSNDSSLGGF